MWNKALIGALRFTVLVLVLTALWYVMNELSNSGIHPFALSLICGSVFLHAAHLINKVW